LNAQHFAHLLKAQLHLAPCQQGAHGHAGFGLYQFVGDQRMQPPALKQLDQFHTARAGGITQAGGRQHSLFQGLYGSYVRCRSAQRHSDRYARMHQVLPTAGHQMAFGQQIVNGVTGQDHAVKRFASHDSLSSIYATYRFNLQSVLRGLGFKHCGQFGQQGLGGHGRNQAKGRGHAIRLPN
jgi:hypothetical protein